MMWTSITDRHFLFFLGTKIHGFEAFLGLDNSRGVREVESM